ncbi:uncharacterized protein LOC133625457 [Colius striatus]|uniref:uncharacterized protein LOC133625457 n=1 Tax=Colius striatus TaxID=57412 RepID=UPI002B1E09E6|nr:uncharacterized protein LOC133625457 [Colius striatus]
MGGCWCWDGAARWLQEVDVELQEVDVDLQEVDVDLQEVDVELQEVDVDLQEVEVDLQEVEVDLQEVEVDLQEVEVDLQEVDVELQEVEVDLQEVEVDLQEVEVELQELDVELQELDVDLQVTRVRADGGYQRFPLGKEAPVGFCLVDLSPCPTWQRELRFLRTSACSRTLWPASELCNSSTELSDTSLRLLGGCSHRRLLAGVASSLPAVTVMQLMQPNLH